jgi:flagellar hook-length control protein FliK
MELTIQTNAGQVSNLSGIKASSSGLGQLHTGAATMENTSGFMSALALALNNVRIMPADSTLTARHIQNPLSLLGNMTNASAAEQEQVERMIAELTDLLEIAPSELMQTLINDNGFNQWLQQASESFAKISGENALKMLSNDTPISEQSRLTEISPINGQDVKPLIREFIAQLSEQLRSKPENQALRQLAVSLEAVIKPLIAVKEHNEPSSNLQTSGLLFSMPEEQPRQDRLMLLRHVMNTPVGYEAAPPPEKGAEAELAPETYDNRTVQQPVQDLALRTPSYSPVAAKSDIQPQIRGHLLAEDMSQFILKGMKVNSAAGFSEARITLVPEHLGKVDVRITITNGNMVAQFVTETALGKELLDSQLMNLRTLLQQQGLHVDKLEVSQSSAHTALFQDQRQQQFSQQFSRQSKEKSMNYEQLNEGFSIDPNEAQWAGHRLNGTSFDVTA